VHAKRDVPLWMNSTSWCNEFRRVAKNRSIAYVYFAGEIETTLRVGVDNGRLVIQRRPDEVIPSTPSGTDASAIRGLAA
jgi:hypothetical protein